MSAEGAALNVKICTNPTVKMALNPPSLSASLSDFREYYNDDFEIVRDFERIRDQYII
ncbi:MAG: hypothetical protein QXS79_00925 [Candidatus Bathyarchaeia archaeon]